MQKDAYFCTGQVLRECCQFTWLQWMVIWTVLKSWWHWCRTSTLIASTSWVGHVFTPQRVAGQHHCLPHF